MNSQVATFVSMYEVDPAERHSLLLRLLVIAVADKWNALAPFIEQGARDDAALIEKIIEYEAASTGERRIRDADRGAERALGAFQGAVVALAALSPEAATAILDALFKRGLAYYTRRVADQQVGLVSQVVVKLRGELAEAVAKLRLGELVDLVESSNSSLREVLDKTPTATVSYASIREGNQRGQERLARIVAHILGDLDDSAEAQARRERILAPIIEVQERIAATFRRPKTLALSIDAERRVLTLGSLELPLGSDEAAWNHILDGASERLVLGLSAALDARNEAGADPELEASVARLRALLRSRGPV